MYVYTDYPRKKIVAKANDLIQKSRFCLSLQQQKIVLFLISRIKPQDEDFEWCEFSTPEFCRVCGISAQGGSEHESIKKSIKDIADKSLWISLDDGGETLVRWIAQATIKNGTIRIRLDDGMKPFLLQLRANYTTYELGYVLGFKSRYSIRLYELAKSIQYDKRVPYERKYSVEELRTLLGAETYAEYRDLKQRTLSVAVKEITEKSDINLSFNEIKFGRRVLAVNLRVDAKNPPSLHFSL